jgi:ketopantoate reductase
MKYTVLGAGAMGLRYGVLLQAAGYQVDFVDTLGISRSKQFNSRVVSMLLVMVKTATWFRFESALPRITMVNRMF